MAVETPLCISGPENPTIKKMLLSKCSTWGTGPIGTTGDGCYDIGEYVFHGSSLAILILILFLAGPSDRFRVLIGFTLAASSLYHVVYGEGTMRDAIKVAESDSLEHGILLALVNTREITVLFFAGFVAWWYPSIISKTYGLLAGVTAAMTSWDSISTVSGIIIFADAFGVVTGVYVATTSLSETWYSKVPKPV